MNDNFAKIISMIVTFSLALVCMIVGILLVTVIDKNVNPNPAALSSLTTIAVALISLVSGIAIGGKFKKK